MNRPQRWEGDTRGIGIGDAREHLEGVRLLEEAMQDGGWVAEEPEAHLMPNIERHIKANGGIWSLSGSRSDGPRFDLALQWRRRGRVSMRLLTQDVYTMLGCFIESNAHIRGYIVEESVIYQITTGALDGDGPFAGHGHVLTLTVTGPSIELLLEQRHRPG